MAIAQWWFFSMPHLLWHPGAHVYNGYLRGPVTLIPIAECLAVELSLPVFTTWVCRCWDSDTQPSACGSNTLTHCATATVTAMYIYDSTKWPISNALFWSIFYLSSDPWAVLFTQAEWFETFQTYSSKHPWYVGNERKIHILPFENLTVLNL